MEPIHKNRKLKQWSGVDNEGWLNTKDSFVQRHSAKKRWAMSSMADAILEVLQKVSRIAQGELYHCIMQDMEIVGWVCKNYARSTKDSNPLSVKPIWLFIQGAKLLFKVTKAYYVNDFMLSIHNWSIKDPK